MRNTLRLITTAATLFIFSLTAEAGIPLQSFITPGGHPVVLLKDDIQDSVAIALAFKCGLACDGEKEYAAGLLAPSLSMDGAGGQSSSEIYENFMDTGAQLNFSANSDETYLSLSAPSSGLDDAVKIANTVLTKPDFPESKLAQKRERLATAVDETRLDADIKAQLAFIDAAVGPSSYDHYFSPQAADIRQVTTEQMRGWLERHVATDGVLISVVGNIEQEKAGEVVDKLLAGLPQKSDDTKFPVLSFQAPKAEPIVVQGDGGKQVVVNFGMIGNRPERLDEWLGGVMLAKIFADGQRSRLFTQVREASGQTYGLESDFNFYEQLGMNRVKGRLGTEGLDQSLAVIRKSWDQFRAEGPTENEIKEARLSMFNELNNIMRDHQLAAERIRDYLTGHWSVAELARMPEIIRDVDLHDKVLRERFFTTDPITVIVK
ncbi:MAG: insulinase family protein [Aestuariivirga sp.]